jgi:quinol monooxygenase YgiN
MAILVINESTVRPDSVDAARECYDALFPATRAFEGCKSVALYEDPKEPGRLVLVEEWDSKASYEAYVTWRMTRPEDFAGLTALSTGEPPNIRIFGEPLA